MTKEDKRKLERTLNILCTDAIDDLHYCQRVRFDDRCIEAKCKLHIVYKMLKNIQTCMPSILTEFHKNTKERIYKALWGNK